MWISGLSALDKPLLHLHTQANVALPWAEIDFDFMNLNQAAHGDREFGYIQTRLALRRKTVVGHVSDPRVVGQVATWARAAAGWAATRTLKLARFGDNMRFVAVTEGDKTEAEAVFGVQVNTWGVNELAKAVADVDPADVDALVTEYQDSYDVATELQIGKERHQSLRDGAAIELGLRSFLDEGGFGAFTTNFEDLGDLRQLPGLAVQRLMEDGYGFGAEGDWKTAVLVRAAKVMGAGLPGGASLMEDYTYDLTPGRELILGAHMLEVCPSLTTARPTLEIHPLGIGRQGRPGPAGVQRRPRSRRGRRAVRRPRPVPAGRERGRGRAAGRAAAEAAGRAGGLAPVAGLPDLGHVLAAGRRGPPHLHVDRGRDRGVRGLRPDRGHRAADDRPVDHRARLRARTALELGLLPAGPRNLTSTLAVKPGPVRKLQKIFPERTVRSAATASCRGSHPTFSEHGRTIFARRLPPECQRVA